MFKIKAAASFGGSTNNTITQQFRLLVKRIKETKDLTSKTVTAAYELNYNCPLKKEMAFKSQYSFFFYLFIGFFLIASLLALYRLSTDDLDLLGFIFIVLVSFLIGYFFSFRFDCQVTLDSKHLKFKYISPFRKTIHINTEQIVEVEKHEDVMKRYHKKIFIGTLTKSYLVKYNISDSSDEKLLKILHTTITK